MQREVGREYVEDAVALGYAITGRRREMASDQTFVLAADGLSTEGPYVAMSRGEGWFYVTGEEARKSAESMPSGGGTWRRPTRCATG